MLSIQIQVCFISGNKLDMIGIFANVTTVQADKWEISGHCKLYVTENASMVHFNDVITGANEVTGLLLSPPPKKNANSILHTPKNTLESYCLIYDFVLACVYCKMFTPIVWHRHHFL